MIGLIFIFFLLYNFFSLFFIKLHRINNIFKLKLIIIDINFYIIFLFISCCKFIIPKIICFLLIRTEIL
jgi:hypothetical protein